MLKYSIIIAFTCLFKAVYSETFDHQKITDEKLHGILPLSNGKVSYSETVDCGAVSATDLFRRARLWISQSAQDQPAILADRESGDVVSRETTMVALPRSESSPGGSYHFKYTLIVECSNRKYRATITNVTVVETASQRSTPVESYSLPNVSENERLYIALDVRLKNVLSDLKQNVQHYKPF